MVEFGKHSRKLLELAYPPEKYGTKAHSRRADGDAILVRRSGEESQDVGHRPELAEQMPAYVSEGEDSNEI